jgi:filamentous hemagglutinin family protein
MSTAVNSNFKQIKNVAIALLLTHPFVIGSAVFAQSIVPANDLGTQINYATTNPQQINITGGTQAGANLYHSFQQFGLDQGQIANFLSNPSIQNILSRVVGGSPSVINGLIQVTGGNSNLYLLNPAGIIFGSNASLNVPAAFTATTASGIQVGNGWFGVNTSVDAIKNLSGNPQAFGFVANTVSSSTPQSAPVLNAGNLAVNQGQSITLVGGLVINTGTIASPAGKVTIAAVPDGKYVKITPEGSLLSLELPVAAQQELAHRSILGSDLPNLLTGSSELRNVTGLNVDNYGNVLVANSPIPSTAGTVIASGNLDVSSTIAKGGEINVLGDRVGLVSANLDASGAIGGGTVLIGGDYLGKGTVPNSQITFVDQASTIKANALRSGNAGKVIVWADDKTSFSGRISARGGIDSGNGGFIETSGKNYLNVQNASVDAAALKGNAGNWLLDPRNITVQTGGTTLFTDPLILSKLNDAADVSNDFTIDPSVIQNATANVELVASENIVFSNSVSTPNGINLSANAGGYISASSINSGGDITFSAPSIYADNLSATGDISISGSIFGDISIVSTNGNISTQSIKILDYSPIPIPDKHRVSLIANNGNIVVDGTIQIGYRPTLGFSEVTIRANSFRAINPEPLNAYNSSLALTAFSLYVFNPRTSGLTGDLASRFELTLPNDSQPRLIAGKATDPLAISIVILKDTLFTFSKVTPLSTSGGSLSMGEKVPSIPLPATGSGFEGAIGFGLESPPSIFVLLSDQSFSSNPNLVINNVSPQINNVGSDEIKTPSTDNATQAARTADLQANISQVKECEPTGSKKQILTIAASLTSSPTRSAKNPNRSKLPPCK